MIRCVFLWPCLGLLALSTAVGCEDPSPNVEPPSPMFSQDAGEFCGARPLTEHCDVAQCPSSFDELKGQLCERFGGTPAQRNSCGGASVATNVGSGTTTWHFDSSGELLGALVFEEFERPCSSSNGVEFIGQRQFGIACQPTNDFIDLCPASCPDIDCLSGVHIDADLPYAFGEVFELTFTACHNTECYSGSLPADARLPAGGSVGFEMPSGEERDARMGGLARLSFSRDPDGMLAVNLEWTPWTDTDLVDGDRFRLLVREPLGEDDYVLIDQRVSYDTRSVGSGACLVVCHYAEQDVRGSDDQDAGVLE